VDNASTDGSNELVRSRYPDVELIENESNLMFAEGNNVGIRRALERGARYILLLNNDTEVESDFLAFGSEDPLLRYPGEDMVRGRFVLSAALGSETFEYKKDGWYFRGCGW